jgi:hypothetical protein
MVVIYCIEDINDVKYVGSTKQRLTARLSGHRIDATRAMMRGRRCSSSKLNLYNCIIYELESCPENERRGRERYWVNKIDCINTHKLNGRDKERQREYNYNYYLSLKLRLVFPDS